MADSSTHGLPLERHPAPGRPLVLRLSSLSPATICVIAAIAWLVLRLIYLVLLSPWNLLGDEAYYWAQGQHPALSYAEKGPLLAWMLAITDAVFGRHEWAVRLPVAIASAAAMWGVGRLTLRLYPQRSHAIWLAAALFVLTPALVANGQICTQDGVLVAVLVALAMFGRAMVASWEDDRPGAWAASVGFYAAMGVGVLLKQSILLSLTALMVQAVVRRRHIRWRSRLFAQQVIGIAIIAIFCTPLIIWDAGHGWPLVRHTLQHLGAAEGEFASRAKGNPATWLGNTLGGLIGASGPALALMTWASISVIRNRRADDSRWRDQLWLLACSWPPILFFVALSVTKPVVPSWPLPYVVTLVPLAAVFLAERWPLTRFVGARHASPATVDRPSAGDACVAPTGALRQVWGWTVVYGVGALLVLSFPTAVGHLPVIGKTLQTKVLDRFIGQREKADAVAAIAAANPSVTTIVVAHYQPTSLLAFYLPPRWTVTCAGSLVGARRLSNFDEWPDTSLYAPARRGGDILLIGGSADEWNRVMAFDAMRPAGDLGFVGIHYGGAKLAPPGEEAAHGHP